jgi:hypothetical protein
MENVNRGERPDPNHPPVGQAEDEAVERIVAEGPRGTWAVAGLATFLVVLVYFLFYFLAYLPRGAVQ